MEDIKTVAKQLGMTISGLRKLVAKREIRYFQHGKHGRILFRPEWVEEFIERHTHAPKMEDVAVSRPRKKKDKPALFPASKHGFDRALFSV